MAHGTWPSDCLDSGILSQIWMFGHEQVPFAALGRVITQTGKDAQSGFSSKSALVMTSCTYNP